MYSMLLKKGMADDAGCDQRKKSAYANTYSAEEPDATNERHHQW